MQFYALNFFSLLVVFKKFLTLFHCWYGIYLVLADLICCRLIAFRSNLVFWGLLVPVRCFALLLQNTELVEDLLSKHCPDIIDHLRMVHLELIVLTPR